MPNPGLPIKYIEKPNVDSQKKDIFEQKIPGRHKIRLIFLLSAIPRHL